MNNNKKKGSIAFKVTIGAVLLTTAILVVLGICLYYRVSGIDEAQYTKMNNKTVAITDAAIELHFAGKNQGYKTYSYNDLSSEDLSVISSLMRVNQISELNEKFIVVDKTGTIIVDQFNSSKVGSNIRSRGINGLEKFNHSQYYIFRTEVDGNRYEIRTFTSSNQYLPMTYIFVIPFKLVDEVDNSIYISLAVAMLLGIIVMSTVMNLICRQIIKPLKIMTVVLKNISEGEGDLTQRLPVHGNDEVSEIAEYFNLTMEKIDSSMKTVQDESVHMETAANVLTNNMTETASALNQIASNISSIRNQVTSQSSGVEHTSKTVETISENIAALNNNIDIQTQSVTQSTSAVKEMVANIRSVTEILQKNEVAVERLSNSADNGREIVLKTVEIVNRISDESEGLMEATNVIKNIAEQTNLLAMNAAIEAAHAGEAGKGFAVVSDEIRKLAEDSNEESRKISQVLGGLQDLIASVTDGSKEMQNQFNLIFDNTQDVKNQESIIKKAMDEQSAGGQQILDAMQQINKISEDVRNGAKTMEEGGQKIYQEMGKLATVTTEISGSMNEMSTGVNDINNSMQAINDQSHQNAESINKVTSEIHKFKV